MGRFLLLLAALLLTPVYVQAQAVFAHFMVGNTETLSQGDWENNMRLAQEAHIDAFALNMAYDWPHNRRSVSRAFAAARARNFKLFFSFDYAGNGPWDVNEVLFFLNTYGRDPAHWQHQGRPLASTFEGPEQADDWIDIKALTGCFFVPDWSSMGAGPAMQLGGGVADGLFSWAAWPYGVSDMTTYVDASYLQALNGKPYMMPVSPWFFTNLPGYNKNWVWNGDHLWYQRWQQVWSVRPEWVQIISWNDFGESHHIGPLDDRQYEAFDVGRAPFNYVVNKPHDGWRVHLPYVIDTYKGMRPAIGRESVVSWFRQTPGKACDSGGTTGNTASQLQIELDPASVLGDRIFVTALLDRPAQLRVGGWIINDWDHEPREGIGLYHHSIPFAGAVGLESGVSVSLWRDNVPFLTVNSGAAVSSTCPNSVMNWNPIVISGESDSTSNVRASLSLSAQVCVEGTGTDNGGFRQLCEFTCKYGYCPVSACTCTLMGPPEAPPPVDPGVSSPGYPANGDANYAGLCSFTCNWGFCPAAQCSTSPQPPFIPSNSPFAFPACISGREQGGEGRWDALCNYACHFGFCPMHRCQCVATGHLIVPPAPNGPGFSSTGEEDHGLCAFACGRGFCPTGCADAQWPIRRAGGPPDTRFLAFGDSYSTGVGAGSQLGSEFDPPNRCLNSDNSYPRYLRRALDGLPTFQTSDISHVGCTAAIAHDIPFADKDGRTAQIQLIVDSGDFNLAGWGTLSIGGNDCGFGNIAESCLFWYSESDCNEAIRKARDELIPNLVPKLVSTYLAIFTETKNKRFLLIVTGYPTFFNESPANCRNGNSWQWFYPWGGPLSDDRRIEINSLIEEANRKIEESVQNVRTILSRIGNRQIKFFPVDSIYEGHRFCEDSPADWQEDSWFHHVLSYDKLPAGNLVPPGGGPPMDLIAHARTCTQVQYDEDQWAERILCKIAVDVSNGDLEDPLLPGQNDVWHIIKAMHPRSIGNNAVGQAIFDYLKTLPQVDGWE